MNSKTTEEKIKNILHPRIDLITISKILLISFTMIFWLGNFTPFYEGDDASIYAITAINLSNGTYSITNELLEQTGSWDFVPRHWTKTVHDTAVPNLSLGFPLLGSIAYILGGYYGLFYLVPIISTIFLILADRIASSVFGRLVGLLTLLFITSNFWILQFGGQTMSDLPFTLVFILGCFFFLKYLHQFTEKYLFFASSLFAFAAFIRLNGIIFFLIEIIIILSFIVYHVYLKRKSQTNRTNLQNFGLNPISINKTLKISFSILGPWAAFLLLMFSYNDYYFGNPYTMQLFVSETRDDEILELFKKEAEKTGQPPITLEQELEIIQEARSKGVNVATGSSIISINQENIQGYLRAILPFPLSHDIEFIDRHDDLFGKYWIGFLTPLLLISIFWIAYKKNHRLLEITVFSIFMLSLILFYSILPAAESQLERNISQRYSIPSFTLFSMMLGFLLLEIFTSNSSSSTLGHKSLKFIKILVFIFIFIFFLVAFYFTPLIQALLDGTFNLNDPKKLAEGYPINNEGLTSKSIIFDSKGYISQHIETIPLKGLRESFNPEKFDVHPTSQGLILKLNQLIKDGYEVYILKDPSREIDKLYFQYLEENFDFVFKEYSTSFCKLNLSENLANSTKSDKVCL